jgi:hypothetical protein
VKCLYCQKTLEVFHDPLELSFSNCKECSVAYRFIVEEEVRVVEWSGTHIEDKKFLIKVFLHFPNKPTFIVYCSTDSERFGIQGTGGSKVMVWDPIMVFDFIPRDWTPHNAAHKIGTYLPFL